jgi:CelD/BcsL family acetyltransferase involved in cellulose biosynthesis
VALTTDLRGAVADAGQAKVHTGVRSVDPLTDGRWEAFVSGHPDALVYHHPAWLEVLERAYGYELVALALEDSGGVFRGVLPLFRTRGVFTGRRLSSLPHTPVAGPLASDDDANAALLRAALEHVGVAGSTRLQIKAESPGLDTLVEGLTAVPWEHTYMLDLPNDPAALRFGNSRNHARIKWSVNKAFKGGVQVRHADAESDLSGWYRLYLETMRDHVVPPRPYRFFKAIWEVLRPRGMVRLLLAEQHANRRRTLVAGSLFLWAGSTAFYAFTGGSRKHLQLRPNDVIQWTALHDACRAGFRRYDLGEVDDDDPGLADFKRKWGAQPTPLYRYYSPAPSDADRRAMQSGRVRRIARSGWRRMPLRATAVVGDLMYRHF